MEPPRQHRVHGRRWSGRKPGKHRRQDTWAFEEWGHRRTPASLAGLGPVPPFLSEGLPHQLPSPSMYRRTVSPSLPSAWVDAHTGRVDLEVGWFHWESPGWDPWMGSPIEPGGHRDTDPDPFPNRDPPPKPKTETKTKTRPWHDGGRWRARHGEVEWRWRKDPGERADVVPWIDGGCRASPSTSMAGRS